MYSARAVILVFSLCVVSCSALLGKYEKESEGVQDAGSGQPLIFAIEGTGKETPITPRAEDLEDWNDHASDRRASDHRIDSAERRLTILGLNLQEISTVVAVGTSDQGTIEFEIVESSHGVLTVAFPTPDVVSEGGLFDLTLTSRGGTLVVQIYLMRGLDEEGGQDPLSCDGVDCELPHGLIVEGDLTAVGMETMEMFDATA